MKCDKQLAVAKEHKGVNREAFRVNCGEPSHYSGPGHYSDPPLLMNWPPDPRPLFEPRPLFKPGLYMDKYDISVGGSGGMPSKESFE